jgi:PAS domain S-box-containing protein
MAPEKEFTASNQENPALYSCQLGETKLLLEAFEMFTQASSSLESAFNQLQRKVQVLTEELESKNLELEKSLHEKEEAQNYLRTILERLPCGVFVLDGNGGLALCNPMAADVLGKSKSSRLRQEAQPALSAGMRNNFARAVGGEEIEIALASGGKKRILATSGAPLTDGAGRRSGTLHIIRDITEMKALQEKSKRIERLSAMGEMAVELAHEIRNPLGSIELFASLLVKELSGDPKRWAENIRIGIRSLNNIVFNMLHFANPISPSFSDVSIHEVIEETLKFMDPIMNQRHVRVEKLFDAENPVMPADRELIRQMMLNLILNAMKAMPANGSLTIITRNFRQKKSRQAGLELHIQDTGIGIPAKNLNRIFDPFFTTNKNGTGLGLSVVHQIVERHSGSIRVSSEVNGGTTFTIVFENDQNGSGFNSKDSIHE